MSQVKQLKKISVKELFGLKRGDDGAANIKKLIETGHEKIFRISGYVTGVASKNTQYGESVALLGQFIAQNLVTGELFKSSKAYMTKDFAENVAGQFKSRSDQNNGIEFKAEVSVVKDSSVATGYSYVVNPIETEETKSWEQKQLSDFAALPAPKKLVQITGKKTA